jgi:hypothetical protein
MFVWFHVGDCGSQKGGAAARKYSSEAALSLRSRRSGTKFVEPSRVHSLSADVFQGVSYGILPCLRCWLAVLLFNSECYDKSRKSKWGDI